MVGNPIIAVGISTLSVIVPEIYNYCRFGRPYCYFRLSVVVAIIWGRFLWTRCWILTLSISIAISGCRSFSQSLTLNSPWSKTPECSWKRTHLFFFYLNSWRLFLPPSATRVRKNRSAIRQLNENTTFWYKPSTRRLPLSCHNRFAQVSVTDRRAVYRVPSNRLWTSLCHNSLAARHKLISHQSRWVIQFIT